jgi:hypothetical protein
MQSQEPKLKQEAGRGVKTASGDALSCCIHIGAHKTASTMLQKHLLAFHPQVEYLGKFPGKISWFADRRYRDKHIKSMIAPMLTGRLDRGGIEKCKQLFKDHVLPQGGNWPSGATDANGGKVVLWSNEELCADTLKCRKDRAENFYDVFAPAKIMVVIRNPLTMAESIYFQRLKIRQFRPDTPSDQVGHYFDFEYWMDHIWPTDEEHMKGSVDYAETIRLYSQLFGVDSIGVFLYEQLIEDADRFIRTICEFIGIDPDRAVELAASKRANPRWTKPQVQRLKNIGNSRLKRALFRGSHVRFRRWMMGTGPGILAANGPAAQADVPDRCKQQLIELTRSGNQYLADQWNLPLEQYGYPL